jgi:hypothetical protein
MGAIMPFISGMATMLSVSQSVSETAEPVGFGNP